MHDDLVLAVVLACGWGEHALGRGWLRLMEQRLDASGRPQLYLSA